MAINKNFVVKNGLEVSTDLILADASTNRVGIGSTIPAEKLDVSGTVAAENAIISGFSTVSQVFNVGSGGTIFAARSDSGYVGVGTGVPSYLLDIRSPVSTGQTALYVYGDARITGDINIDDITLDQADVNRLYVTQNIDINGGGSLYVTGITTIGSVEISSGIITATTGIVTYYGDGSKLQNIGVGIATEGGLVGTGATILDLRGPGVSTVTVSSGIATINISGGGGASVSISSEAPSSPASGDLWYSTEYGRTFVWYDEVILGIGSTAVWVDASPFNQTGSYLSIYGGNMIAGLGVTPGSLSSPSVYFNNSSNSGFYSPTIGQFGIVSSGTEIVNINSNGINVSGIVTATNLNVTDIITSSGVVVSGAATATDFNASGIITSSGAVISGIITASGAAISGIITSSGVVVSGAVTATDFNASGIITSSGAVISGIITASGASFTGNVSIGGTLTYEDVTNIDAVGLITARSGIHIGDVSIGATLSSSGDAIFVGVITATDFNSTSDVNLKQNIETVDNALGVLNELRGVRFEWKKDGKPSYGVIAQELEKVLPELVTDTDPKTVNYNGIIGILIEAVKELSIEIEELKNNK